VTAASPAGDPAPVVLIVDDYEPNRKLTRDVLQVGGFRTLEAGTGAEALALAVSQLPDVILLDLRLPDLDGVEVARRLRTDARTARIPIVALSSVQLGAGEDRPGWFAGALDKPIRVADLADQVRSYCGDGTA
jgi:CheY-like chemotaxis protein